MLEADGCLLYWHHALDDGVHSISTAAIVLVLITLPICPVLKMPHHPAARHPSEFHGLRFGACLCRKTFNWSRTCAGIGSLRWSVSARFGLPRTLNCRHKATNSGSVGGNFDRFAIAAVLPLGKPRRQVTRLTRKPVPEFVTRERFDGESL